MQKFLLTLFSILISYFCIFFYFFFLLEKNFENNFKNKKTTFFYENYFSQIEHLRYKESYRKKLITEELIFNYLKKEKGNRTILFQGDSWMQQINKEKSSKDLIKLKFKQYSQIINAGTASYSPSLMFKQFKILEEDFKIFPQTLVVYIDQTDMGDELCRYKKLIHFSKNGEIKSVPGETFPYYRDVFNLHEKISLSSIEHRNINKFFKTQLLINYKIKKAVIKSKKRIQIFLDKNHNNLGKCKWEIIENYKKNLSKEDKAYLIKILKNFFSYLEKKNYLKSIYIVTHPHKLQLIQNNQPVDISEIVSESIKNFNKIEHINFSKILKNKNIYKNFHDIWFRDSIHLQEEEFNLFLLEISNRVS